MANIYLFSGPCGCGKTTLSSVFAEHLGQPVYLIHGDDFQAGFITPADADGPAWPEILRFNWECILASTRSALALGVDVVIDYVVEDELPLMQALARDFGAALYYVVLTADAPTLQGRLKQRGDAWLTERALFLKAKLDALPENQGHLFDLTGLSIDEALARLQADRYIL